MSTNAADGPSDAAIAPPTGRTVPISTEFSRTNVVEPPAVNADVQLDNRESKLLQRQTPWCTFCLVLCYMSCHSAILMGNLMTATAMDMVGGSTTGWSNVGLGVSRALREDIDHRMDNITQELLGSLTQVTAIQDMMNSIISFAGVQTEQAVQQTTALLQVEGLDADSSGNISLSFVVPTIVQKVHSGMQGILTQATTLLKQLMVILRPVLEDIGEWLVKFGDIVQAGFTEFSQSLDKAQKVFDTIMAQLSSGNKALIKQEMLQETFGLFDVSSVGGVTLTDLQDAAKIYTITALQGDKAKEMHAKYDADKNGLLTFAEMLKMVDDPSIPGSMATILRTYSKEIAMLAGNIGYLELRTPLSGAVVSYLQMLVAKDPTVLSWYAQALGNGSIPIQFTAAVMAQLCLKREERTVSAIDIGSIVIEKMYLFHSDTVAKALDMMSDYNYWFNQGFETSMQPVCMGVVTKWITDARWGMVAHSAPARDPNAPSMFHALDPNASNATGNSSTIETPTETPTDTPAALLEIKDYQHDSNYDTYEDGETDLDLDAALLEMESIDREILAAMPYHAHRLALLATQEAEQLRHEERASSREQLYASRTSRHLLDVLLHGVAPTDGQSNARVEQAIRAGEKALPLTLAWAKLVAANMTRDAANYQSLCFKYSSESSSALDSFATKLQGMVKKVTMFLALMKEWASPEGINKIETYIEDFTTHGIHDLLLAVESAVIHLLNEEMPSIEAAANSAVHDISAQASNVIGGMLGSGIGHAIVEPLSDSLGKALGSNATANATGKGPAFGTQIGGMIGDGVSGMVSDLIGDKIEDLIEGLVNQALGAVNNTLSSSTQASLLAMSSSRGLVRVDHQGQRVMTGAFADLADLLKVFSNIIPTATTTLKLAQQEVSQAVASMSNVFTIFASTGKPIFDDVSLMFKYIAWGHFCFEMPLGIVILFYGLWAHGWFGGPKPIPGFVSAYQAPKTWRETLSTCCCFACLFRPAEEQDGPPPPKKTWKQFFVELPEKIVTNGYDCIIGWTYCMRRFHDTSLCIWMVISFLQLLGVVAFLIALVFIMLAGVRLFIKMGCAQIYILGDLTTCGDGIQNIKSFLNGFFVVQPLESFEYVCDENSLLTCNLIAWKVMESSLMTGGCGFVAFIISIQIIIHTGSLHEQARYRRKAAELLLLEELEACLGDDEALERANASGMFADVDTDGDGQLSQEEVKAALENFARAKH